MIPFAKDDEYNPRIILSVRPAFSQHQVQSDPVKENPQLTPFQSRKYRLVIFDFDGTLADSFPWFLEIFADLARQYHLPPLESAHLKKLRALEVSQILKEYRVPFWKLILISSHLQKLMNRQIGKINLVDGMQPVIDALAASPIQMAVVTSNAEANVRAVLGPRNMAHIHYIESGVAMFGKKRKFQKILMKTGIPASQALCIGDEVRDLRSSREANIPFGAVNWGCTALTTLLQHAPDEVFHHPGQILEALLPPVPSGEPS
jgi:phosphoglycolate phosphatase